MIYNLYMKKKKVAIITGANSGIGLSTSNHLASKEFNLILCSRKPMDDECKKISDKYNNICTNYIFDASEISQLYNIADKILNENNQIDVLINNIGTLKTSLFQMTKDDDIRSQFEVNFFSHVFFTKKFINVLKKSDAPSIINVSSTSGIDNNIGRMSYNASKAAMISFTESLSKDLAMFKIRVNCIAPGLVDTKMMTNSTPPKVLDNLILNNSTKRVGKPEEIANLIYFLISKESSYINGQTIRIDGGMQ